MPVYPVAGHANDTFCFSLQIRDLEDQLEKRIHLQQLLAVISDPEEYQSALEEAGFVSLEASKQILCVIIIVCVDQTVLQEITSIQEALEVERTRLQVTQQKMQGVTGDSTSTVGSEQVDPQWIQTLQLRKKVSNRNVHSFKVQ